jgi:prophage regulatory protein
MDTLLKRTDVERKIGQGRSRIYQMIGEGAFPRPVRIGGAVRWSAREIDEWIAARLAERDAPPNSREAA